MKVYQPIYDAEIWDQESFRSYMVFVSRQTSEKMMPGLATSEYDLEDIEGPWIVDLQEAIENAAWDLVNATDEVLKSWESGSLAEAVNGMDPAALRELLELSAKQQEALPF